VWRRVRASAVGAGRQNWTADEEEGLTRPAVPARSMRNFQSPYNYAANLWQTGLFCPSDKRASLLAACCSIWPPDAKVETKFWCIPGSERGLAMNESRRLLNRNRGEIACDRTDFARALGSFPSGVHSLGRCRSAPCARDRRVADRGGPASTAAQQALAMVCAAIEIQAPELVYCGQLSACTQAQHQRACRIDECDDLELAHPNAHAGQIPAPCNFAPGR